ncbi:MAG: PTS sugar transporter subunit IIC [Enterobacteriaceae bacterium]
MKAATQIALGDNFGYVGYVFVLAFFTNLLLVLFGRYTRVKGIFLTGNTGVSHSQAVLWLIVFWLGFGWVQSIIIAGVLTGIFWAFATTLIAKPVAKITNNAGFTIAHNQMLGIWFFSKFAHLFGDAEKQDAENMKRPKLAIFNHNVTAIIVMTLFVGGFLLSTGIENVQLMAKVTLVYLYYQPRLQFSMYGHSPAGVRMMVGEINASFKGWQDRLPDAIPAVDVAALLPFSPNAATLDSSSAPSAPYFRWVLLITKSPIMVLPGFVPLFFSGGPIGVLANRMGGYRSVIICTFLLGIIQTFGTVWAIPLTGLAAEGVGWTGIFDWATLWPAICELLKLIATVFNLGPYAG